MAKVNRFDFGSIVIDGKQYDYDVVVIPGSGKERETSKAMYGDHMIRKAEIEKLAKTKPGTVILGTGTGRLATMSEDGQAYARKAKLNLVVLPSSEATAKFNLPVDEGKRVAAFIHITC